MRHADFQRRWRIARVISHADGSEAQFAGTASIGADWVYEEIGTLSMGGQSFEATRTYLWHPVEGGFDIRFDDGRAFHRLRFDDMVADHWCDPDTYRVSYDLRAFPDWSATWRVTGPRKDYSMITRYAPFVGM
ncbi:DUF6314 family protein [Shimia ponticola]|uniref:DUF6314 family protein n=1 Tax=Shimia ponticola TaxID=2582893 RepID=UPI0011BF8F90|nr:DUF6314 family protein [Shimia ponticola]